MRMLPMWVLRLGKLLTSPKFRAAIQLGAVLVFALAILSLPELTFAQSYLEDKLTGFAVDIARLINLVTNAVGSLIIVVLDLFLTPILEYNGFSTSETISRGWSMVRDVVNMFVVLVLLVIAVSTILGIKRTTWEQSLPQFLIAVVLVNFSRTICGLLLDASQIVMFTFVNAIKETAAGNFTQMLGINLYGVYSESIGEEAIKGIAYVGAAVMQFWLYIVILIVLFILALVFLYRIVILWVLVILSPLTFFLGGISGIFSFAGASNGQWWSKFTAALTLGPLLTFFLWLALAAASGGNIAESELFKGAETTQNNLLLETFEGTNLLGTILGLVFLIVGMQQAAQSAAGLGEFSGKLINEGMGRKLIGGTAYWTTGGSATRRPLTRAAAEGARRATGSLLNLGSSNYLGAATGTSRFGRARAAIQRSVGRSITNLAGEGNRRAIGYQQAEFKRALDRRAAMTDDEKLAHLRMATAIGGASTSLNMQTRDDVRAAILDLALNKGSRKQAEANMSDTEYRDSLGMAMRYAEGLRRGNDLDSGQLDKLNQFKTEAAHVLADIDADELRSHVQSDKFSLRDMSAAAASNPAVVAQLERKMVGDGVSAADRIRRGLEGEGLQNAINSSNSNPIYNSSRATNGRLSLHEMPGLTVNDVASNVVLKNIRVNEIVTDDILGPNRLPVVQGLLQAGKSRDDIRDAAARAEFVDTARALSRTGALNQKQQFVHDMDELHDGTDAHALFTDRGGAFDQARAIAVLRSRPEFAGRLEAQVAASNPAVSGAVAGAINSRQVQDLVYRVRNTNNTDEQQRLTRSLETMVQAMDQHARSISPSLIRGELNAADPELLATYNALRRTSEELNLSTMQRISDS